VQVWAGPVVAVDLSVARPVQGCHERLDSVGVGLQFGVPGEQSRCTCSDLAPFGASGRFARLTNRASADIVRSISRSASTLRDPAKTRRRIVI
jgi:hypothetical protein